MLNRGMANRLLVNRAPQSNVSYQLLARLVENLTGDAGTGAIYSATFRASEQLTGRGQGAMGYRRTVVLGEELIGNAVSTTQFVRSVALAEALQGNAASTCDIHLSASLTETLHASGWIGADILMQSALLTERLNGQGWMGADITTAAFLYETLLGSLSLYDVEYSITEIAGALPPGGELIIDSDPDHFQVLLNGTNAIHLHKGDWIRIGRRTVDITVQATNDNNFELEVYYYTLYL